MRHQILKYCLLSLAFLFSAACSQKDHTAANTVRVGVLLGSAEQQLLEGAKEIAQEEYALTIEVVPYTYPSEINMSLSKHEIDADFFQYPAYLEYSEKKHDYNLVSIGETYIYPMAIYSQKIKNILDIKPGAVIAIPEEPTNQARALFLLEKAGLIRLRTDNDMNATDDDIIANPSNFEFRKLASGILTNALPNVDIAVINAGFALAAGLVPSKNALVIENENSNYANIVVVCEDDKDQPRMKVLIEVLRSSKVEAIAEKIFKDNAIPAWKY